MSEVSPRPDQVNVVWQTYYICQYIFGIHRQEIPEKKNNLKKDKLILVVSKIVLYLYSIMRRYKDQKLFQKKNKNN
jgi:hypothetical protein